MDIKKFKVNILHLSMKKKITGEKKKKRGQILKKEEKYCKEIFRKEFSIGDPLLNFIFEEYTFRIFNIVTFMMQKND